MDGKGREVGVKKKRRVEVIVTIRRSTEEYEGVQPSNSPTGGRFPLSSQRDCKLQLHQYTDYTHPNST